MSRLGTLVALALFLVGCGGEDTNSAVQNNERTVGDPAVIARIESETSCPRLHREFSIAVGNATRMIKDGDDASVPLAYQSAANLRMIDLGCYG